MLQKQITQQIQDQDNPMAEAGHLIPPDQRHLARPSTAALYRCPGCKVWWGGSQQTSLQDNQALRLVEPHTEQFLWEDYRGWRNGNDLSTCPECGEKGVG